MNHKEQWNNFFTIEQNIAYGPHLQETLQKAHERLNTTARKRGPSLSFRGLVAKQFRFLAWKIWLMQGMILAALCAVFFCFYTASLIRWPGSTLPKFLCCCSCIIAMSAIPILKRSVSYQMAELERSTHFSTGGNVLSQLLFIGIGDVCMLTLLALFISKSGLTTSVILISLVIPFLTAATACLMLWARTPFSVFERTAVPLCILPCLSICALFGQLWDRYGSLTSKAGYAGWIAYALVCTTLLYNECRRLYRPDEYRIFMHIKN